MKILLKDIKPNPYRNLEKFRIDEAKVESLKGSIEETTFWDNILVREKNAHYELAYGHHRLLALEMLNYKKIDIPVKEISDAQMLKIMANENMAEWRSDIRIITQTVEQVRNYLNGELKKVEDWGALKGFLRRLVDKYNFISIKNKGVGLTTILRFLGKPWTRYQVQRALETLNLIDENLVDEEDLYKTSGFDSAKEVHGIAKEIIKKGGTKKEARRKAKKIAEVAARVGAGRRTLRDAKVSVKLGLDPEMVVRGLPEIPKKKPHKLKSRPDIDKFVYETCGLLNQVTVNLDKAKDWLDYIEQESTKGILLGSLNRAHDIIHSLLQLEKEIQNVEKSNLVQINRGSPS